MRLPGRLRPLGGGIRFAEQQRLQPRFDRHLQVPGSGRLAPEGRDDPVPQPADLLLQRPEELTGADELVPAGQHLAPQQGAVLGLHLNRADRLGVGVVHLGPQLGDHLELLVHRLGPASGACRYQRPDRAVQRPVHDLGPAGLVVGQRGQPAADRLNGRDRAAGPRHPPWSRGRRTGASRPARVRSSSARDAVAPRPWPAAAPGPAPQPRRRCARRGRDEELPGHGVGVAGRRGDEEPQVGGGQQLGGQLPVLRHHRVDVRGVENGQARPGWSPRPPAAGTGRAAPRRWSGPAPGRIRSSANQRASLLWWTSTGARVVGRITPGALTRRPTRELTRVDLPAPVEPPTTASSGASIVASRGNT